MSWCERRLPFEQGALIADLLVRKLKLACERIHVVGSIRRQASTIGDIELLVKPRYQLEERRGELFPAFDRVNLLERRLAELLSEDTGEPPPRLLSSHPVHPANGPKYKRLWAPRWGVSVDLFIVEHDALWGAAEAIRTGPADFSRLLVTSLRKRGLRCHELEVLREDGGAIPCPTEQQFFNLCGVPYIAPPARGA